jgi:hypothetical protein
LNIKAESINLDVLQNGDKNTFENKHVNELILKVVQDGQNNTIKMFRYHANGTDVNMEFIQKGIIKVFRIMVNSISKDMKVSKGNGAAVIILTVNKHIMRKNNLFNIIFICCCR